MTEIVENSWNRRVKIHAWQNACWLGKLTLTTVLYSYSRSSKNTTKVFQKKLYSLIVKNTLHLTACYKIKDLGFSYKYVSIPN